MQLLLGLMLMLSQPEKYVARSQEQYQKNTEQSKISEREAIILAKAFRIHVKDFYFDQVPIMMVGDWYLIGIPEKNRLPFAGLYIHRDTGRIQFRCSKETTKHSVGYVKEYSAIINVDLDQMADFPNSVQLICKIGNI